MTDFALYALFSLQVAQEALQILVNLKSERAEEFRQLSQEKFALSTLFKAPADLAALRESVLNPPKEPEAQESTK